MPSELTPIVNPKSTRCPERASSGPPSPTDVLCRYRDEQRLADRRLGLLVQRDDLEVDLEADTLLDQQCARVTAACGVQADSVEGVAAKLEIWFIDRLTDGLDEPEDELDRLVATARADLHRLLSAG